MSPLNRGSLSQADLRVGAIPTGNAPGSASVEAGDRKPGKHGTVSSLESNQAKLTPFPDTISWYENGGRSRVSKSELASPVGI